jgi:hypothetical protein
MAHKSLIWVDIGMAVLLGGFVAIVVFFRTDDVFVPLMLAYAAIVVIWSVVAEGAAMRAEAAPAAATKPAPTTKQPLPH